MCQQYVCTIQYHFLLLKCIIFFLIFYWLKQFFLFRNIFQKWTSMPFNCKIMNTIIGWSAENARWTHEETQYPRLTISMLLYNNKFFIQVLKYLSPGRERATSRSLSNLINYMKIYLRNETDFELPVGSETGECRSSAVWDQNIDHDEIIKSFRCTYISCIYDWKEKLRLLVYLYQSRWNL